MTPQTRILRGRTGRALLGALVVALLGAAGAGTAAADDGEPNGPPQFVQPVAPPDAIVGTGYVYAIPVASGLPVTCTVADGGLPDGLTLRSDCVLLGTPTTVGTSAFTITAANGVAPDPALPVSLTVNQRPGLSSTDVPAATVGQAYSYQLPLTGTGPVTVTEIGPDHLPDGLVVDPDGLIHGTPTTPATLFGWGLRLDGVAGSTAVSLWFTVTGVGPSAISTPPAATLGEPYSFTFTASGNPAPSFSINGPYPPGLDFDFATGTLSGTPTQVGSYPLTVRADNFYGSTSAVVTLDVVGAAPEITNSPSAATAGVPYSFTFQATASPAPTYTVTAGTLPRGLVLYADGVISGTPTEVTDGTPVTVTATNGVGPDAVVTFTLPVHAGPPTISGTPPTGVDQYLSYSFQYTLRGLPAPTTTVSDGTLPPGLTLDDSGYLSGFPSTPGTYTFTVRASNGATPDGVVTSTVVVNGPAPTPPPSGTISGTPPTAGVGEPYTFRFSATGTVTRSAGSLPPGLSLSSSGRLSGTPTRAGTYAFTVQTVAGSAAPVTLPVTLVVRPVPTVSVSCVAVAEGDRGTRPLTVSVTMSRASSVPVSVRWTTANGTAVSGSDYLGASGTVSFAPGQTSKTVTVQVRGDRTHERDEYFLVRLARPSHATIDHGTAVAAVRNDD